MIKQPLFLLLLPLLFVAGNMA
jgi:antitoxin component YwqK of YwqJK toxin-antitoxin module